MIHVAQIKQANWPRVPGVKYQLLIGNCPSPAQFFKSKRSSAHIHPSIARESYQELHAYTAPARPQLLAQSHSNQSCEVQYARYCYHGDAGVTCKRNIALSVYTADCLPILVSCPKGQYIAAIHAGWRGLYHGIISKTIHQIPVDNRALVIWIGPSICRRRYPVSEDFRDDFIRKDVRSAQFFHIESMQVYFDCRGYALCQLKDAGVICVHQAPYCTFEDPMLPSYRRLGPKSQRRIFSLIWRE